MGQLISKPPIPFDVPLCRRDQLQDGRFALETDQGDALLVMAIGDDLHVVDGLCPHQYFPLEFADLEQQTILVCPLHGWRFNVTTGQSPDVAQICLNHWPAIERDGFVYAVQSDAPAAGTP